MLAIRNLLRANPQIIRNAIQQRNMSVIATPARNKVSTGLLLCIVKELLGAAYEILRTINIGVPEYQADTYQEVILLSSLMVLGWSAIPAYVLVNIKNYRHKD